MHLQFFTGGENGSISLSSPAVRMQAQGIQYKEQQENSVFLCSSASQTVYQPWAASLDKLHKRFTMNKKVTKPMLESHTEFSVTDTFMCQEYKGLLEEQKKLMQ